MSNKEEDEARYKRLGEKIAEYILYLILAVITIVVLALAIRFGTLILGF